MLRHANRHEIATVDGGLRPPNPLLETTRLLLSSGRTRHRSPLDGGITDGGGEPRAEARE